VSRLKREVVKKSIYQIKLQKNKVISMNQLNSKAPEKSHATEQLFSYNCLYGTYFGGRFTVP